MWWYLIFKWLHILSAIAAFGANITYAFWIQKAARSPQNLVYTLQTIKTIDGRLANPAYGSLLATGIVMVFLGRWALTTSWLDVALGLYITVGLLGFFVFAPLLRRQIQAAETSGPESAEYQAAARHNATLGRIVGLIVVLIVLLMVAKPRFWG